VRQTTDGNGPGFVPTPVCTRQSLSATPPRRPALRLGRWTAAGGPAAINTVAPPRSNAQRRLRALLPEKSATSTSCNAGVSGPGEYP